MTDPIDDDVRAPHLRDADFLGAFAVLESDAGILMVQNRRVIAGEPTLTWDLPGGQVEPGETVAEALVRELREEVRLEVEGRPSFLFVQEGLRVQGGVRRYAWRSFFFRVVRWRGEAEASSEVLDCRVVPRSAMGELLTAPYHDSFRSWLAEGGSFFESVWED